MELGDVIKAYRKQHGLSLRNFAQKCEMSHTYIAKLENGIDPRTRKKVEPTLDTVKKISATIGTRLDELLRMTGYIESESHETTPDYSIETDHTDNSKQKTSEKLVDDTELVIFWHQLEKRDDLQLLVKQIKNMPPNEIKMIIRIIKAIKNEGGENNGLF